MVALLAGLAIMTFGLMLALPSWNYLVRDDKEQELIFRGRQISNGVARFQRKNGNALPATFEQLVEGKYLRKAYKDPMTKDGKWRVLRPGEGLPVTPPRGPGQPAPATTPSPSPTPRSVFGSTSGPTTGPIAGVASLSTETGLRSVNGSPNYNRWVFAPNVPFVIGGPSPVGPGGPGGGGAASQRPRAPDLELPRVSR
ncbi:MAG: type II secretion system protein [Vicinamibacteria bacterium]|nr:type II secretion system protein [Vicinamibacteria bacterium]